MLRGGGLARIIPAPPPPSPPPPPFLGYLGTCAWHLQAAAVAGALLQAGPGPPAPAGRVRHRHGGRRWWWGRRGGPPPPADCEGRWAEECLPDLLPPPPRWGWWREHMPLPQDLLGRSRRRDCIACAAAAASCCWLYSGWVAATRAGAGPGWHLHSCKYSCSLIGLLHSGSLIELLSGGAASRRRRRRRREGGCAGGGGDESGSGSGGGGGVDGGGGGPQGGIGAGAAPLQNRSDTPKPPAKKIKSGGGPRASAASRQDPRLRKEGGRAGGAGAHWP